MLFRRVENRVDLVQNYQQVGRSICSHAVVELFHGCDDEY